MNMNFQSKEELLKRVYPALEAKKRELKRLGYKNIKELDIWNFLSINVFSKKQGLMLSDIVSAIMHVDIHKLDIYIKQKLSNNLYY